MAKDERALGITEDIKHVLGILNLRYPNWVPGETVYRTVIGVSSEYTKRRAHRDLTYLNDKGIIKFKGMNGIEAMSITVNDCAFALTAKGFELANRLADDPTLDLWPEM
ncbi:MAG: hypothetical protein HS101_16095 [Planctomycetia bacterium]|nr:hypothetical protein [Planctomycetia bacterium]MCC7315131.1 hypothetical protein [Planctomycetota bacterium]